jgi:hypothetical protein
VSAPLTVEGAGLWALMTRLGGQVRLSAGMGGAVYLGWDMTAALALGRAMGLRGWLLAEVLPDCEAVAMAALNKGES